MKKGLDKNDFMIQIEVLPVMELRTKIMIKFFYPMHVALFFYLLKQEITYSYITSILYIEGVKQSS